VTPDEQIRLERPLKRLLDKAETV